MFFGKPAKNGGGTPVTSLTGTPTEIVYIDNAGNGTSDALATRDSVTNETYIGYRTDSSRFTNALKLGNFLGSLIPDGVGFERHDGSLDNYTFWSAIDATSIGGRPNSLVGGYIDFTNSIFSTATFDEVSGGFDYNNSVLGVGGNIQLNATNAYILYSDNGNTFYTQTQYQSNGITTRYKNIGANASTELFTGDGFISGGDRVNERKSMTFNLDDNSQQFYVKGLKNGSNLGDMLNLNAQFGTMRMGDTTEISSRVFYEVNDTNGFARVHGLQSVVPNWTPSTLSDGFTGTGLNDMHYDSTTTYTGTYPRVYTATISAVDCVRLQIYSITTPGFTVGDTVTDLVSGSTGTILSGGDAEGIIIIQPIIDNGWNTATQVDDITSGASSLCIFNQYTDTFDWNDGGTFVTYKDTDTFVLLNDGLSVGFYNFTGHTIGDSWQFTMLQGTVYSKMALFDGANRTMSIGDVEQTVNDVRTDWVLGQGKDTGIYEYLGKAREYVVYNDEGNLLVVNYQPDNNFELNFGIDNPHSGFSPLSSVSDNSAYGFGININDTSAHYTIIGDLQGGGNNTLLRVDDDTETIKFAAGGLGTDSQDIPITKKIVLTQAELSTLGTVPIVVVPAPGAGKAIQPISAYAEYEYGGVAYANFGIPGLTHNPSSGSLPLKSTVSLLDQTANYVRFFKQTDEGYNAGFTIDNQPLYFTDDDGSDPTAGNGTLTLYVTYKIIKL